MSKDQNYIIPGNLRHARFEFVDVYDMTSEGSDIVQGGYVPEQTKHIKLLLQLCVQRSNDSHIEENPLIE